MRLHHLRATAFGPFASTVDIDFDDLSGAGLFLLYGPTGAGKTSVLDAVCFALYGQVPGDRGGARHLRCDQAAPGLAPEVVLQASVGDRTLRFHRSPAWSRPKRRGSGETRVQAHVVVEELRDGDWVALTNRLDEAGHLVSDLLGMTATQFTQVAMLPQGRFQAFLRATSPERHAVLQKLFRTDRFEQVERWLVDRRGAARRASEAGEQRVREVLHRLQEAAEAPLPEEWADDLAGAAERHDPTRWAEGLVSTSAAVQVRAAADHEVAAAARQEADQALTAGRASAELRERAGAATQALDSLAARHGELTELRHRLTAHRRAAPLAGLAAHAETCRRRAEEAASAWQARRAALGQVGVETEPEPSPGELAELQRAAVADLARAEAFRAGAAELDRTRERHESLGDRLAALDALVAGIDAELAAVPDQLTAARLAVDEARHAAASMPAATSEVAALEELAAAAARLAELGPRLDEARDELAAATAAALAARESYLDVREARIHNMAAELAGGLAAGCACPVCGSASHPEPARPFGSTVARDDEEAARVAHEDAAFVQQTAEVKVATLAAETEALTARLGQADPSSLTARLSTARATRDDLATLAGALERRLAALAELEDRSRSRGEDHARAILERASARQERTSLEGRITALSGELDDLLAGVAPDLDTLISHRARRCTTLDEALAARTRLTGALTSRHEADQQLLEAARAAGFPGRGEALAAILPGDRAQDAERHLADAEATRLAAQSTLADPLVVEAVAGPAPDLDALDRSRHAAAERARAAAACLDAADRRSTRVSELAQQLESRLGSWAPLREEHALVASLSQLVEGKGPDNPLKIRLAAYVLAERLRQVVAAANERLARMTDQRYALEHTDDRGAGEQRGGLSLRVRDDWSGLSRDPATLSGGETFVVSLALALGLADTVAHEAGGTDIDTLFIDEGFGSLDSETLEDVMDTLDTLRDGGRVVGIVSHVPELRSRIPTQLEVRKGRAGSSVHPVLGAG